ncbi:MAG: VCBS repeat-containing protein [Gemmataceae bacterium]
MRRFRRFLLSVALGVALASLLLVSRPPEVRAYVEAPHSLGMIVNLSTHIVLLRVASVDRKDNNIIFTKVRDIKGKHLQTEIRHAIGKRGFEPREWQTIMNWAEVGKLAVMFHNGTAAETCIGHYWHQTYGNHADVNGWWSMVHGEPYLLRAFSGRVDKLVTAVEAILANQEVVVPIMTGSNDDLKAMKGKIGRVRASLKLDYNLKRDFVGWGGEDYRRVAGMPGFTHLGSMARVDPDAQAISVVDFNADGKLDVVLSGGSRLALLQNDGEALGETSLPGVTGSRASVWADYNADGLPDLLVAAPTGPKLFTNLGKNEFRDDSHLLPAEPGYNVTCAAWIDQDGDGRPDILLGNGWHGLRLYRNEGKADKMPTIALGGWRYIGPFPNGGKGFASEYPPEKAIDYKAQYPGKGKQVGWAEGKFVDGQVNSLTLFGDNTDAVCYVHREITCARAMKLPISLGSDDGLAVFLNGKKILAANESRACAPDQHRLTLDLKQGRNDLLLKITQGVGDWGFYFNPLEKLPPPRSWTFSDVSDVVGLGEKGIGSDTKGDALTVCDLDGDGKADFLYRVGKGLMVANDGKRFRLIADSGLDLSGGRGGPVIGDANGDGKPDLLLAGPTGLRLWLNEGGFRFREATKAAGLDGIGPVTCAAWGDVDNDGQLDLIVGRLRACNRMYRNKGDGTFEDVTVQVGLHQRIFNTQAIAVADLNGDGVLDLLLSNEGQDSVALLGNPEVMAKRTPVSLTLASKTGLIGARLALLDPAGKLLAARELTGGEGRGDQSFGTSRFAVEPGRYTVELRLSNGEKRTADITVAESHLKTKLE